MSDILNKEKDGFVNEQIRALELMVIGPNGEKLGVKSREDALTLAKYAGFDLVVISPNSTPQVAKIMDHNKYKYEMQKKQKENLKRQKETNLEIKEYRLSASIDIHDFNTRVRNAGEYLKKGHKIKGSIRFRGRELAHTELGKEVLLRFADALKEISEIEKYPSMEGRSMLIFLTPKKDIK